MTNSSMFWIGVPADVLASAITKNAVNSRLKSWDIPVHQIAGNEIAAIGDAVLSGLDLWYDLAYPQDKLERIPENTIYLIKTILHWEGELPASISSDALLGVAGDAYTITIDMEDKWAACCRATVLYNKDNSPAGRLLGKESLETCLEHYNMLLQDDRLKAVVEANERVSFVDLVSSKYIHKLYSESILTTTANKEPSAQADITEYVFYLKNYLENLERNIRTLGQSDTPGELVGRVTLFGTSIAVPVYIDRLLRITDTETIAKWILDDKAAEYELLYNLAETNYKVALLLCVERAIKHVIEKDEFCYEECRLRLECPGSKVMSWFRKNEPGELEELETYLR